MTDVSDVERMWQAVCPNCDDPERLNLREDELRRAAAGDALCVSGCGYERGCYSMGVHPGKGSAMTDVKVDVDELELHCDPTECVGRVTALEVERDALRRKIEAARAGLGGIARLYCVYDQPGSGPAFGGGRCNEGAVADVYGRCPHVDARALLALLAEDAPVPEPVTSPTSTEPSCEHCGCLMLPKRKEPLLCTDCISRCSDDCDHRWPDDHPLCGMPIATTAEYEIAKCPERMPCDIHVHCGAPVWVGQFGAPCPNTLPCSAHPVGRTCGCHDDESCQGCFARAAKVEGGVDRLTHEPSCRLPWVHDGPCLPDTRPATLGEIVREELNRG